MQEVGCNAPDGRVAKLLAADAHKFLIDVLNDIIAVSNVKPMPALNPRNKEQRIHLGVRELYDAFKEAGIDLRKPAFYLDRNPK
jgi:hypothetical protein